MRAPVVDVVIDNFDYGRFLGAAIESALDQTYPHTRVTVVDDGSRDDSLAVARARERTGMLKIKRLRKIDAVVRGWRPSTEDGTLGALIFGLYDQDGTPPRDRSLLRLHRQGEARAAGAAGAVRDRRARHRASPATVGGAATSSGSPCGPSWWWRSPSTT